MPACVPRSASLAPEGLRNELRRAGFFVVNARTNRLFNLTGTWCGEPQRNGGFADVLACRRQYLRERDRLYPPLSADRSNEFSPDYDALTIDGGDRT
jgi:hypothetical protein